MFEGRRRHRPHRPNHPPRPRPRPPAPAPPRRAREPPPPTDPPTERPPPIPGEPQPPADPAIRRPPRQLTATRQLHQLPRPAPRNRRPPGRGSSSRRATPVPDAGTRARSPRSLPPNSPLPTKTVLISSSATPKLSSAITGTPRATASIAAVELTVSRPSARPSAELIGSVDTTRFAGRLPRAARSSSSSPG